MDFRNQTIRNTRIDQGKIASRRKKALKDAIECIRKQIQYLAFDANAARKWGGSEAMRRAERRQEALKKDVVILEGLMEELF